MSEQYPGGFITKAPPTPQGNRASSSAYGIWNLAQQSYYQALGLWPDPAYPVDAQFNYVTMLLHADGTNGATNGGSSSSNTPPFNTDASTNALSIAINGDAQPNNFNPYNGSYYSNYFDGSGDYISYGTNTSTYFGDGNDFTMEAWVFPTAYNSYGPIFSNDLSSGLGFGKLASGFGIRKWGSGDIVYTATPPTIGVWTHVAAVRSGNNYYIFYNGVQQATATSSTTYINGTAAIGGDPSTSSEAWTGYISNARYIKSQALSTSNFTPPTAPVTTTAVGWTGSGVASSITGTVGILACQSNRFVDNSGNSYTLTIGGNTAVSYSQPFTLPSTYSTYGSGYFDGTTDYLVAQSSANLALGTSDFCVEWWEYRTSIANDKPAIQAGPGSANYDALFGYTVSSSNRIYLSSTGSSWNVISSGDIGSVDLNTWNQFVVTRSGTTFRGFKNGVLTYTTTSSASIYQSANQFALGTGQVSSQCFSGYMSGARVTIGSIPTDYQTSSTTIGAVVYTPPTSPLTAVTNTQLLTLQTNGAANDSGFLDSSPNNFPIARAGNATQGSFSPYGSNWSNYFNGSTDYFTVPNDGDLQFGSGAFTMEAFIFPTASVYGCIASKGNYPSSGYFEFRTNTSNKIDFYDSNLGASITSTATINLNQWNHVAVCRSGSTITLYINGSSSGSATDGGSFSNTGTFAIGAASQGSYTNFFTGYISNFRMVKGTAVYTTNPYNVPTAPLTAIPESSILTCQSNRFVDNGTHPNFTITAVGTPSVQRFNPFGASTAYSTATIGGSGYFDGSGDYISVANSTAFDFGSGDFTIEGWVYRTSNSGNQSICSKYEPSYQSSWSIDTNGSNWEVAIYYGSTSYVNVYTGSVPALNQWVHFALERNGSYNEFYVNGSRVAQIAAQTIRTTTSGVRIGELGAGYSGYAFAGNISDLRIRKGTATYSGATYTIPTAPLTAATNTSLLCNFTNAGVIDNAMRNDLETVGSAQISTSVKKYGTGSLRLSASGNTLRTQYSNPSLSMGTGDFTIEGWVYFSSTPSTNGVFQMSQTLGGFAANQTQNLGLATASSSTWQIYAKGTYTTSSSTTITVGSWIHFALVRSVTTTVLYINGSALITLTSDSTNYNTPYIGLGSIYDATSYPLVGYIDDLRITKGYARYTTDFTPPTSAFPNIGPT